MGIDLDRRPEPEDLHLVQQQRLGFEVDVVLEADPGGLDLLDLLPGRRRRGRQAGDGQLQLLHLLQQCGFHLVPAEGEARMRGTQRRGMEGEMGVRKMTEKIYNKIMDKLQFLNFFDSRD